MEVQLYLAICYCCGTPTPTYTHLHLHLLEPLQSLSHHRRSKAPRGRDNSQQADNTWRTIISEPSKATSAIKQNRTEQNTSEHQRQSMRLITLLFEHRQGSPPCTSSPTSDC